MEDDKTSSRGYDDNAYLKEMADGIISRRFASVDEAARAVLCEEPGSNVDRLRRKFREQGWYERGLNDFVEAEIARRGSKIEEVPRQYLFNPNGTPKSPLETRFLLLCRDTYRGLTPRGHLSFLTVILTACMMNVHVGTMGSAELVMIMTILSLCGMANWAKDAAGITARGSFLRHLGCMVALFFSTIAVFKVYMPDVAYTTGSLPGSFTLAVAAIVVTGFIGKKAAFAMEQDGRKSSAEMGALILVLFVVQVFGCTQLAVGVTTATNRDQAVQTASTRMEKVLSDFKAKNPGVDIEPIRQAQEEILIKTAQPPQWGKPTGQ